MAIRVLPSGDHALLVEVGAPEQVGALYPALDAARLRGIGELVPSTRTVLVTLDPSRLSLNAAERWIRGVDALGASVAPVSSDFAPNVTPHGAPPTSIPIAERSNDRALSQLTVLDPGVLALVQDRGRPGLAHLGISAAGAMDRAAHNLANRLVGNDPSAATLELLLGGFSATVDSPVWFAVTGAWGALTLDGRPVEPHTATRAAAGSVLRIGAATDGLRYYLAVRGGIAVNPVEGSRSRDTLAALGPAPVVAGDILPVGPVPETAIPSVDLVPVGPPDANVTLALRPGPRADWFDEESWRRLFTTTWVASARADRTGVCLELPAGCAPARASTTRTPPLRRTREDELPSEGMVAGAIQVSPGGYPTILTADHPVTGVHPVIAVVTDATLDLLAQLRPGSTVNFTLATGHL